MRILAGFRRNANAATLLRRLQPPGPEVGMHFHLCPRQKRLQFDFRQCVFAGPDAFSYAKKMKSIMPERLNPAGIRRPAVKQT